MSVRRIISWVSEDAVYKYLGHVQYSKLLEAMMSLGFKDMTDRYLAVEELGGNVAKVTYYVNSSIMWVNNFPSDFIAKIEAESAHM